VHFVAYGGGNALTLVKQDGTSQPETGGPEPQYIQVTLPEGVTAGQTVHVQAPDGKVNAIVVPPGFGPGSTFTVEFAPDTTMPPPSAQATAPVEAQAELLGKEDATSAPLASATAAPAHAPSSGPPPLQPSRPDDGFVSGFGR
jgi:hypothetical protein